MLCVLSNCIITFSESSKGEANHCTTKKATLVLKISYMKAWIWLCHRLPELSGTSRWRQYFIYGLPLSTSALKYGADHYILPTVTISASFLSVPLLISNSARGETKLLFYK